MTVFNRFLILLGLFLSFNLNAFCQNDEEEEDEDVNAKIVEQLRQKYDDAEFFSKGFFVKQNGKWEFADENGKILTNMNIENVESYYFSAEVTIKGKKYEVSDPFEDGKVLVGKYGHYAYMDSDGDLITRFIYDGTGEEVEGDPAEIEAIIDISDQILKVYKEVEQGSYSSVKTLEKSIGFEQAGKLDSAIADSLLVLLCKTYEKNPKKIDMKIAESLFEGTIEPCAQDGCEAVIDYYTSHGTDKQKRFEYIQSLADDYNQHHAHIVLGDFLVEGVICPKDIQRAIDNYKQVLMAGYDYNGVDYGECAHDKLAEIWKKYGSKYDNQLGMLCAENEKVEFYTDEYILLTNEGQKMMIDTSMHLVLPKGDFDIYSNNGDYFVIEEASSGTQLVKKGGKVVLNGNFEDIQIINDDDDLQVVALKDGKWGFYDKEGKPITSMIFDDFSLGYWANPSIVFKGEEYTIYSLFIDGMMVLEKDDSFGCVDTQGEVVIPFVYDGMAFSPKGNLVVLKDEKYGVIDKSGNVIKPIIYDDIDINEE